LASQFAGQPLMEAHLVVDSGRPTTRKIRFVSEHHSTHLMRADWELATPIAPTIEDAVMREALAAIAGVGAVILSDYAKGVLTPRVIRAIVDSAHAAGKPVIVDPKGLDYEIYRGATITTPNRKEPGEAAHRPVGSEAEIAAAAADLAERVGTEAVLITRSEDGMTLYRKGVGTVHVPAYPVRVRDVSGAGDTVVAVMSALLAMNADFEIAMRAANAAASIVVGKRGTAVVSTAELRARLLPHAALAAEEKIVFDSRVLRDHVESWRRAGFRVGFTNGCFDLIHPGHIRLLTQARAACDRLVVGLNSDASVQGLKGPGRPIQDEQARAQVLAALEAVDLVVLFDEPTPIELIRLVRPKLLVKGSDYRREQVVGGDFVEASGGEVLLVDLIPGQSTTRLVDASRKQTG
ncbi:MAG: D-glycero-beta-D-manno-heptose 1-phosphate adenylyltransferase, partial [Rhizobiales bacterium]|nr:D-glycero-beta-D-manno-heptose 1-phosphate adenylyltransferase [Hyphomicrobiales bacterium]